MGKVGAQAHDGILLYDGERVRAVSDKDGPFKRERPDDPGQVRRAAEGPEELVGGGRSIEDNVLVQQALGSPRRALVHMPEPGEEVDRNEPRRHAVEREQENVLDQLGRERIKPCHSLALYSERVQRVIPTPERANPNGGATFF